MDNKESFWGDEPADVDKPVWSPVFTSFKGITVSWQEKYGEARTESCMGLWEGPSQYMLSYKDKGGLIIQKDNCDDLKYSENA